jgi:hypothetical protein
MNVSTCEPIQKEAMSQNAERWIAEQEIVLLEAVYELDSPAERDEWREPMLLRVEKVRVSKSRSAREPTTPDDAITG